MAPQRKAGGGGSTDSSAVFVRGLPEGTDDASLRSWFESKIGPTVTCFAIKGGSGLVKFKQEPDAQRCLEELQGSEYEGSALRLEAARTKGETRRSARAKPPPVQKGAKKAPAAAAARSASEAAPWEGKLDLRAVKLSGLPAGTAKEEVKAWVEKELRGGCGLEAVKRALGEGEATSFVVTFRKESNGRRALEVLHGKKLGGSRVSASFRALEVSQQTTKAGRLIVRNLAFSATEKHVRKAFGKLGELSEVHLPVKADAGAGGPAHRGFAFVQYVNRELAERAVTELNGVKICGRGVAVDWSVQAGLYDGLRREESKMQSRSENGGDSERASKSSKNAADVDDDDEDDADAGDKEADDEDDEGEEEEEEEEADEEEDAAAEVSRMKGLLEDKDEDEDEDDDEDEEDGGEPAAKRSKKGAKGEKRPPRKAGFDVEEGRTIFVRNVPFDATEQELRQCLKPYGGVATVKFVRDPTGQNAHRGSAFIKFKDLEGANAALAAEDEAQRKLKELSAVVKRSETRDLPPVEGFGVCLKGRRLIVRQAVKPQEAQKIAEEKKPEKGAARREKMGWMHLLHVGEIKEDSHKWESLSKSEQRQRQASVKERKWRINNPNFAIHPQRLSVRNLPGNVDTNRLREAIVDYLSKHSDDEGGKGKKSRRKEAQAAIAKASLVRDSERKTADNQRRSRGFGFVAFRDHKTAMKVLEFLNDNPKVFGGSRRPIVEFAIEDKRKLRVQEDVLLKKKQAAEKKLERAVAEGNRQKTGQLAPDGAEEKSWEDSAKRKFKKRTESRGRKQREKRRARKAAEAEQAKTKAAMDQVKAAKQAKWQQQKALEKAARPKKRSWREVSDAAQSGKKARRQKPGEMADDFELRALERFRQGGH